MTAKIIEILLTENAGEPLVAHPSATLIPVTIQSAEFSRRRSHTILGIKSQN